MRCTCTNVSCEWVFCRPPPSVVAKFISQPTETGAIFLEKITIGQTVKNARNSNFVVQWLLSQFADEDDGDEGDKFPQVGQKNLQPV